MIPAVYILMGCFFYSFNLSIDASELLNDFFLVRWGWVLYCNICPILISVLLIFHTLCYDLSFIIITFVSFHFHCHRHFVFPWQLLCYLMLCPCAILLGGKIEGENPQIYFVLIFIVSDLKMLWLVFMKYFQLFILCVVLY